jgi:sigma-E factor negative regulatory protein RseC
MFEVGIVVKLKGKRALVRFDRKSACDSCHMCAVTRDGMKVETLVENTLSANVGDYVAVEMGGKFVLTAAAVVYIIPLLLIGAGLWLGTLFSEIHQVIFAAVGLVLGFVIAVLCDRAARKKKGFAPHMTRFASESELDKKPLGKRE